MSVQSLWRRILGFSLVFLFSIGTDFAFAEAADPSPGAKLYAEALRYLEGDGVAKDERKGVDLLKKAHAEGYAPASNHLGICYQTGTGMWFRRARKGYEVLQEAAETGYIPAIYNLAMALFDGEGTTADPDRAVALLEALTARELDPDLDEATAHFHSTILADAFNRLGNHYLSKEDYTKAFPAFRAAADQDNLNAQLQAARLLALGQGTKASLQNAEGLLERARRNFSSRVRQIADQYYSDALLGDTEGYLLEEEARDQAESLVQDMRVRIAQELAAHDTFAGSTEEAIHWFRRAAKNGNPYASARLGYLYLDGERDQISAEEALDGLRLAAEKEFYLGLHGMGVYYTTIDPDPELARVWFERGKAEGYYASAKALEDSTFARPILLEENVRLAQAAAKKGDPEALFALGIYHWHGAGVEVDRNAAVRLFRQAAEQNHPGAIHHEGLAYFFGLANPGAFKNPMKAAKEKFAQAAKLGYAESYSMLGTIFEEGLDVTIDYGQALNCYAEAIVRDPKSSARVKLAGLILKADLSDHFPDVVSHLEIAIGEKNSRAMFLLGALYRDGTIVEQDFDQARHWFEQAADTDENAQALFILGEMHRLGEGLPPNPQTAFPYYERASRQGHLRAMEITAEGYEKGLYGATYRPRVAARLYGQLLQRERWQYFANYFHLLLETDQIEELRSVLAISTLPIDPEVERFYDGYIRFTQSSSDDYRKRGLKGIIRAAKAGFEPAQTYLISILPRYKTPTRAVREVLDSIQLKENADAYAALADLQLKRPEWFETSPEASIAMLTEAANAGSLLALQLLFEWRDSEIAASLPEDAQLMTWLQPWAERGFETAIELLEALRPEPAEDPDRPAAIHFDDRLALIGR